MEQSELNIDSETFNLRVQAGIPQLTYCLWGNIVKDPRYVAAPPTHLCCGHS